MSDVVRESNAIVDDDMNYRTENGIRSEWTMTKP